jgi:hypothetical protein
MTTLRPTLILVLGVVVGGSACSSGNNSSDAGGMTGTGPYLPLQVGNYWIYKITTDNKTTDTKVQSVSRQETVGGTGPSASTMAFRLVTGNRVNDPEGDLSWQGLVDQRVVRYREQAIDGKDGYLKNETYWDPPRLRLDETAEHTVKAAAWRETYSEHKTDVDRDDAGAPFTPDGGVTAMDGEDLWTVVATDEKVTVPAGTFYTIKLRRSANSANDIKNYWFARGVGKVREAAADESHIEELESFLVLPATQ